MEDINLNEKQVMAFASIYEQVCIARKDFHWVYSNEGIPFLNIDKDNKPRELRKSQIYKLLSGNNTIGLSPFVDNNNVLYGAIDVDAHTGSDDNKLTLAIKRKDADIRRDKYIEWFNKNGYLYFINSSGSISGWHIRVYPPHPIPGYMMAKFLEKVQYELFNKLIDEIYPKQDELTEVTPYGNQIKAPLSRHKKHNRLSLIYTDRMLSMSESLWFLDDFREKISKAKPIFILKKKEPKETIDNYGNKDTPRYCAVIEEFATNYEFPTGYYNRNHYIDPNVNVYTADKPDIRQAYLSRQKRREGSLKNWSKRDNKFSCAQILAYLNAHSDNPMIKKCIGKCSACPYNNATNR